MAGSCQLGPRCSGDTCGFTREEWDTRGSIVERGVEIFAALTYFALGLSHVVQAGAWAELFLLLKSHGKAGVFLDGFINLLLGAIIVSFHNVWHGLAMVVTIIGWGQ